MAGLQRSSKSFRRQGSSGLVWDDKSLSEEVNQLIRREGNGDNRELRHCYSIGGIGMMANIESDVAAPSAYLRSLSAPVTKPSSVEGKSVGASGNGKPPTSKFSFKFGKKNNT